MKILFITLGLGNSHNGAVRFSKLLYESKLLEFDFLSPNAPAMDGCIDFNVKTNWWQNKISLFYFAKGIGLKLNKIDVDYDILIFNNAFLASQYNGTKPIICFIHDEKLMSKKRTTLFDYFRNWQLRKIEILGAKKSAHVVLNSIYLEKEATQKYPFLTGKSSVIYQGINLNNKLEPYKHRELLNKEIIKILFVKSNPNIGGLEDLINAINLIPSKNIKLTTIGLISTSFYDKIDLSTTDVDNRGVLTNEEVLQEMHSHDILCIPSLSEGLGVSVIEGLSIGIPVITTGVGGLPEVTNHGNHIWECQPNSPRSIIEQIEKCISSPDDVKLKSKKGRDYVLDKFDFHKLEIALLTLINNVISGRSF